MSLMGQVRRSGRGAPRVRSISNTRPLVAPRHTAASCHCTKSLCDSGEVRPVLSTAATEAIVGRGRSALSGASSSRRPHHEYYVTDNSNTGRPIASHQIKHEQSDHLAQNDNYLDERIKRVSASTTESLEVGYERERSMLSANVRYRAEVVPWPAKPLKYLMGQNVKSPYLATFVPERLSCIPVRLPMTDLNRRKLCPATKSP
jgi:hypothetical protein